SAILGLALAVASVRCDQLDATLCQFGIELVGLVGAIPNEVLWSLPHQHLRDGGLHQRDFMRRGALHVYRRWKTMAVSDLHNLRPLAAFRLPDTAPSLLGGRETAINECLPQMKVAFVVERRGNDGEDVLQHSGLNPLLKTPMAGLV